NLDLQTGLTVPGRAYHFQLTSIVQQRRAKAACGGSLRCIVLTLPAIKDKLLILPQHLEHMSLYLNHSHPELTRPLTTRPVDSGGRRNNTAVCPYGNQEISTATGAASGTTNTAV